MGRQSLDNDKYNTVYLSIRDKLARIVSRIVPPKDIEDIVQETYVRLCLVTQKEEINSPRTYLYRTARNLALDLMRRSETRLSVGFENEGEENEELFEPHNLNDSTYDQVASNEEFAFFCEAIRHLPIQCRKAFLLKKVYGYSQREVAERLSLSENTIEKHIALGMKKCTYYLRQKSGAHTSIDRGSLSHSSEPEAHQ